MQKSLPLMLFLAVTIPTCHAAERKMAWSQTLAERVTPISDTNLYAEIPTLYRPTHELGGSLYTRADLFGSGEELYELVTYNGHLAFDSTDESMATSTYLLIENGSITKAEVCQKRNLRTLLAAPQLRVS